jgi:hypothetical protein
MDDAFFRSEFLPSSFGCCFDSDSSLRHNSRTHTPFGASFAGDCRQHVVGYLVLVKTQGTGDPQKAKTEQELRRVAIKLSVWSSIIFWSGRPEWIAAD